jgi:HPt (histidine-containing phosphotransfer) domain-containing protein
MSLEKHGKAFLSSLALPEIYRMALDGYPSVLDEMEQQIRGADEKTVVSPFLQLTNCVPILG